MRLFSLAVALSLSLAGSVAAPAATNPDDLIHARLLADKTAVRPGEPFLLGVLLEIKPGWHIYWQNPGDSGLPTRVKISAPTGYGIGAVRYPIPQRIEQPGNEVVFGYSGTVLLLVEIKVPRGNAITAARAVGADAAAAFSADVSWLCCQDVCIPGKSHAEVELPANIESAPANEALFKQWQPRLPASLGDKSAPAQGAVTTSPADNALECSVVLHWDTPPTQVQFFPGPEEALKITDVVIKNDKADSAIRFRVSALKGVKLTSDHLMTVIAAKNAAGAWRGVTVDCPLGKLK